MMLALSVLDLPFSAGKAMVKFDGNKMTYTPADLLIAFHEEVRPVGGQAGKVQILVSPNFYRPGDPYPHENGEPPPKPATWPIRLLARMRTPVLVDHSPARTS